MKRALNLIISLTFVTALFGEDVSFTVNKDSSCQYETIIFTNESDLTGIDTTGIDFYWHYSETDIDTAYHSSYTFNETGMHTVQLVADSAGENKGDTTITILINEVYMGVADTTICVLDSVLLNGSWRHDAGNYIETFESALGCDSIVTTSLSVVGAVPGNTWAEEICYGDSAFIANAWRTWEGTYYDTIPVEDDCDLVNAITLIINPNLHFNNDTAICAGDSVFLAGGWQTSPGIYDDQYSTHKTCDSIIATNLIIETCNTGITANANSPIFTVYPNPASNILFIRVNEFNSSHLKIYNMLGSRVKEIEVHEHYFKIDISDMHSGLYLMSYFDSTSIIRILNGNN